MLPCLPDVFADVPGVRMRDPQPCVEKLPSRDVRRLQKVDPVRSGWNTGRQQQSRDTNIWTHVQRETMLKASSRMKGFLGQSTCRQGDGWGCRIVQDSQIALRENVTAILTNPNIPALEQTPCSACHRGATRKTKEKDRSGSHDTKTKQNPEPPFCGRWQLTRADHDHCEGDHDEIDK